MEGFGPLVCMGVSREGNKDQLIETMWHPMKFFLLIFGSSSTIWDPGELAQKDLRNIRREEEKIMEGQAGYEGSLSAAVQPSSFGIDDEVQRDLASLSSTFGLGSAVQRELARQRLSQMAPPGFEKVPVGSLDGVSDKRKRSDNGDDYMETQVGDQGKSPAHPAK